jgi:hypothetical protein
MAFRSDRSRSGWLPIAAIVLVALILIEILWPTKDQP